MISSNIFAGMVVNAVSLTLNQFMKTDTTEREALGPPYSTLTRKVLSMFPFTVSRSSQQHMKANPVKVPNVFFLSIVPVRKRKKGAWIFLQGQSGTGTGCLETFWLSHLWKCSRPVWIELWTIWYIGKCPYPLQGNWNEMIFKAPSNLNHSMILLSISLDSTIS